MKEVVFDLEADGLTPTKIHCVSANLDKDKVQTTHDYERMRKFFTNPKRIFIGHNITRFDIPVVERLLGIKVKAKLVDTLALSWYLEPKRVRHGLAEWGEEFGVPKPKIDDWDNLTPEEYAHRCEQDVRINMKLWKRQWKRLVKLYGSPEEAWRLIDYLQGKMDVAALQEACKWRLDIVRCKKGLEDLRAEKDHKVKALAEAMPKVAEYKTKNYPAKPYKQNGDLSEHGKAWFELLKQEGLPPDHTLPIKYVSGHKEPNPGSVPQVKAWLYSLGWEPRTFKHVRNKETNEIRKIEQINDKEEEGVCNSIKELYHKEPSLELLDGLSILTHRISILQGFLDNVDEQGYVQAQIQGITNTLRFKHKVCVNLPGVRKPYGELIRGCLIADEGFELCGSDMSSLEDRTGGHFMFDFDPDYVIEKSEPGYDPHLKMAVEANLMTEDEMLFYKWYDAQH